MYSLSKSSAEIFSQKRFSLGNRITTNVVVSLQYYYISDYVQEEIRLQRLNTVTQEAPAHKEKIPGSVETVSVDRIRVHSYFLEERITIAQKN